MKKITFTLIIALLAGAAVFAEGNQEQTAPGYGRGQGMANPQGTSRYNDSYTGDVIEVKGEIEIQDSGVLELKSGSDVYELRYHFADISSLDLKDGDEITVKGILVPGPRWDTDNDDNNLMVTSAVVNGKEYDLSADTDFVPGRMMASSKGRGRGGMAGGTMGGNRSW